MRLPGEKKEKDISLHHLNCIIFIIENALTKGRNGLSCTVCLCVPASCQVQMLREGKYLIFPRGNKIFSPGSLHNFFG